MNHLPRGMRILRTVLSALPAALAWTLLAGSPWAAESPSAGGDGSLLEEPHDADSDEGNLLRDEPWEDNIAEEPWPDLPEETEWELPQADPDRLILPLLRGEEEEPLTAGELLELFEIPARRLDALADGESPLSLPAETELLLRLLHRYPDIPKEVQEQWAGANAPAGIFDWSQLATDPAANRGNIFPIKGRVIEVRKLRPDDAAADRYQLAEVYRVRLRLANSNQTADIFSRTIPRAWQQGDMSGMESGALAMFLKRGSADDPSTPLVFATDHVAWFRDTLLGDLGFDYALFDQVVSARPIVGAERECFYRMLSVVGMAGTSEYFRYAERDIVVQGRRLIQQRQRLREMLDSQPTDPQRDRALNISEELRLLERRIERARQGQHELIPLLESPRDHQGELRLFRGVARRVNRVRVHDVDIISRFGIDHYYQIDAIIELEIRIKLPDSPFGDGPLERWSYPVTFCVRRLPEGMPIGEDLHEEVRLAGFFFKNWAYFPDGRETDDAPQFVAPMLIGREPIWIPQAPRGENPYTGAIAGAFFLIALLGVWFGIWRLGRGDKRFQQETLARNYRLERGVSLNALNLEVTEGPDFTHLSRAAEEEEREDPPPESETAAGAESPRDAADEDRTALRHDT